MAKSRICSIPDCGKRRLARGLCSAHYWRLMRHGEATAGATSKGAAQRFFREVVLTYEGDECLTWPYDCSTSGYGRLHYDGKQRNVSRVLCEAVHGHPPSPAHHAAHSCGRGHLGCVAKGHIDWKSPIANAADKIGHGTATKGEKNGSAKLTLAQVEAIRSGPHSQSQKTLAAQYGVSQTLISQIRLGKIWK